MPLCLLRTACVHESLASDGSSDEAEGSWSRRQAGPAGFASNFFLRPLIMFSNSLGQNSFLVLYIHRIILAVRRRSWALIWLGHHQLCCRRCWSRVEISQNLLSKRHFQDVRITFDRSCYCLQACLCCTCLGMQCSMSVSCAGITLPSTDDFQHKSSETARCAALCITRAICQETDFFPQDWAKITLRFEVRAAVFLS
jgi:hypothetical protein